MVEWNGHFSIRPVQPEKVVHLEGGPVFSKLFLLDRTDPLSFGPKFSEILVEWIVPLGFGIRNPTIGIQNQRLKSSTWNPEFTAWNLECKTILDSLTWGERKITPGP